MVVTHFCKACGKATEAEAVAGNPELGAMVSVTTCRACGRYGAVGWMWDRHPAGTLLVEYGIGREERPEP